MRKRCCGDLRLRAVILNCKNLALFNNTMLKEWGIVLFLLMMSRQGSTQVPSEANQADQHNYASAPQQTNPGAPQQTNPGPPQQTNPGPPLQTNPGAPLQTNPGAPQQTNPGSPQQTNPGPPQQTNTGAPLQTNLNLPLQTDPSAPLQTNPSQLGPIVPPPTLSRARGVRFQVDPFFNPYFQDSSNMNLLRAQTSRYWNYGRPTLPLIYRNSYRMPFSNQALRFFAMNELFDIL
ncbi:uncharacterized protein [Haliotis asinina]|uniref:uncharacterized protein n=1 Tax=Haliotis asinina TaxID=109174 RepID=UPI003531D031